MLNPLVPSTDMNDIVLKKFPPSSLDVTIASIISSAVYFTDVFPVIFAKLYISVTSFVLTKFGATHSALVGVSNESFTQPKNTADVNKMAKIFLILFFITF